MTLSPMKRGLLLALAHVLLVAALGGKLLFDRSHYPRIWVETMPVDPNLPIRGRYVQLQVVMRAEDFEWPEDADQLRWQRFPATLAVRSDGLVAYSAVVDKQGLEVRLITRDDGRHATLAEPLAYFIPEHIRDPSLRPPGETLWVEVTVPPKGPPRPIRLGIKRGDSAIVPLDS